jgi:hypothetical protein
MFFRKRPREDESPGADEPDALETQGERVNHGAYGIIPRAKQLYNGNWIARITLVEHRSEGERRYDFAGPMAEFESAEAACTAGVQHAIERLERPQPQTS